jgi:hypothetical protein
VDESSFKQFNAQRKRGHVLKGQHALGVGKSRRDGGTFNLIMALSPHEGVVGYILWNGTTTAEVYYMFMRFVVLPRLVQSGVVGRVVFDDNLRAHDTYRADLVVRFAAHGLHLMHNCKHSPDHAFVEYGNNYVDQFLRHHTSLIHGERCAACA